MPTRALEGVPQPSGCRPIMVLVFALILGGGLGVSSSAMAEGAAPAPVMPPVAPKAPGSATNGPAVSEKPDIISVSRVVGEVDDRFVTSREVRISDAIDQALSKSESKTPRKILSGQERTFPMEVSQVLDEWVVYLEAKSFSSASPAKSDVSTALQAVHETWGGRAAWLDLEVSAEELRAMIERKIVARAFEKLKGDAALVPISDEDALQYFKKNRLRFGSLPFTAFKDNIKAFLIKQQTERRLSEWHDVLRRKYKVRNFIAG